jgi:hypothetical protein
MSGGAHRWMLQPWMGSAGLSMDFSFFILLTEADIKPPRKRSDLP